MMDDHGNAGGPSTSTRHAEPTHPLFSPFRALGLISEGGTPFVMQRRGRETFVVTSVGTSWQVRAGIDGKQFNSSCMTETVRSGAHSHAWPVPCRFIMRNLCGCG